MVTKRKSDEREFLRNPKSCLELERSCYKKAFIHPT